VEPWLQAGKYAAALMSQIPRRNGWTIAEQAGDRAPDRTQRLLNRVVWDAGAAAGVVRGSRWRAWIKPLAGGAWWWLRSMRLGRSSRVSAPPV